MHIKLTTDQKTELETRHRVERDKQICDRIKAVLLRSDQRQLEIPFSVKISFLRRK